jgi:hypothetical protein
MFYPNKKGNYFSMSKKNFNKISGLKIKSTIKIQNIENNNSKNYSINKIEDTALGRKRIYLNTSKTSELLGLKKIVGYISEPNLADEIDGTIITYMNEHEEIIVDWREIIYQMAVDFREYGQNDDYISKLQKLNPKTCIKGKTGYEQYYTDLLGFWPDLYRFKEG